jgi:hypothetical protein
MGKPITSWYTLQPDRRFPYLTRQLRAIQAPAVQDSFHMSAPVQKWFFLTFGEPVSALCRRRGLGIKKEQVLVIPRNLHWGEDTAA